VIAIATSVLFAVGRLTRLASPSPESDARHPSGLALVPRRGPCRASIDDRLGLAYDRALRFAHEHADDFGYPGATAGISLS
jgi:hypothetical protein